MGQDPGTIPATISSNSIQIRYPDFNNPTKPYALDTDDIDKFPFYIRYANTEEPWLLELAEVRINPRDKSQDKKYKAPKNPGDHFRLGYHSGMIAYLLPA